MDASSSGDSTSNDLGKMKKILGLYDVIAMRSPSLQHDSTYKRGPNRIDIVLTDPTPYNSVISATHLSFDELTMSDHKAVQIEFRLDALFDTSITHRTKPASRSLELRNPRKVLSYISKLETHCQIHKITEKLAKCRETLFTNPKDPVGLQTFRQLQMQIERGQRVAEKGCGQLHLSVPYSPTVDAARRNIAAWRKAKREFSISNTVVANTRTSLNCGNVPVHMLRNKRDIVRGLTYAWYLLKHIQQRSIDIREQFLNERAYYYSTVTKRTEHAIILSIQQSELTRKLFHKLRHIIKPHCTGTIDRLIVDDSDTNERYTICNTKEMHNALLCNSYKTLSSGRHTFPSHTSTRQYIGDYGENLGALEILTGQAQELHRNLDADQIAWLDALAWNTDSESSNTTPIDPWITGPQFKELLLKTKEYTASSPSGLHMGHYIAASHSSILSEILATAISIPLVLASHASGGRTPSITCSKRFLEPRYFINYVSYSCSKTTSTYI